MRLATLVQGLHWLYNLPHFSSLRVYKEYPIYHSLKTSRLDQSNEKSSFQLLFSIEYHQFFSRFLQITTCIIICVRCTNQQLLQIGLLLLSQPSATDSVLLYPSAELSPTLRYFVVLFHQYHAESQIAPLSSTCPKIHHKYVVLSFNFFGSMYLKMERHVVVTLKSSILL